MRYLREEVRQRERSEETLSVWFVIPSARPAIEIEDVLTRWHGKGYKIALFLDANPSAYGKEKMADFGIMDDYPGYAQAVNILADAVLKHDQSCDWLVTGGDDTSPDPELTADEIAQQCSQHFFTLSGPAEALRKSTTFGVMQPTGDRFAGGCIDRIAGSPWLGREWCLRANGGRGPFWQQFTHMFGDECLKRTAEKLGVYWARPDLTHFHNHFMRETQAIDSRAIGIPPPPHLVKWNTPQHWDEMKAIFKRLEAEDFKPCMPSEL